MCNELLSDAGLYLFEVAVTAIATILAGGIGLFGFALIVLGIDRLGKKFIK